MKGLYTGLGWDGRQLPRLYRAIKVKIDTLRPYIVYGGGVGEGDEVVERKVRRVLCDDGWKWQIVKECRKQDEWDYFLEADQECLDNLHQ